MDKIQRDRQVWTFEHTPLKAWLWGAAILVWWPSLFVYATFGYVTTRHVLVCERTAVVTCRILERNAAGVTIYHTATLSPVTQASVREDEDGDYTVYYVLLQVGEGSYCRFPDISLHNRDHAQAMATDINSFVSNRLTTSWEGEFRDFSALTKAYAIGITALLIGGSLCMFNHRLKITCDRARGEIRFEGRSLILSKYSQTAKFPQLKLTVREVKDNYDNTQGYEAIAELPESVNHKFRWGFNQLTRSQKPTAIAAERDLEKLQEFFAGPFDRLGS
ncbi:MAG: hypothetical protein ACUVSQ_11785 [Pseudanabaenaceae cyanobacterium]